MVRAIPAVSRLDEAQLLDVDLKALESVREVVEKQTLHFEQGSAQFAPGQRDRLPPLARQIRELLRVAQGLGRGARVEIVGHTDGGGSESTNRRLSERRAERLLSLLVSEGVASIHDPKAPASTLQSASPPINHAPLRPSASAPSERTVS